MANRAWAGSSTNNASDPNAWVPTGAPVAGDVLFMAGGGMNVTGDDLAGDTIYLEGGGAAATFNVNALNTGLALAEQFYGQSVTVNIGGDDNWAGGISTYPQINGVVTVNGPGEWDNSNTTIDGAAKISANIGGTGQLNFTNAHTQAQADISGAVASGQKVSVDGYAEYGGEHGDLKIDNPVSYQAPTTLGYGEIHLEGLQADSYFQDTNKLTLYNGGNAVYTLNLTVVQNQSGGPSGVGQDFGVSQTADGVVIHTDGTHYTGDGTLLPVFPAGGTYQYLPPDGPLGPVTPINNHTLLGGPGAYSVHSTGLSFIASSTDSVGFVPDSSFDLTIQPQGGVVSLAGSWNLSIANAGVFEVLDNTTGAGHNMLVAGLPVSTVLTELQPTDNMYLQGVTQADIDAAFKNMRVQSGPGGVSNLEILTMPRAGGSALTLLIPASIHGPAAATAAQFHGF